MKTKKLQKSKVNKITLCYQLKVLTNESKDIIVRRAYQIDIKIWELVREGVALRDIKIFPIWN